MMIIEKLLRPICNLQGSYVDQEKPLPSVNGRKLSDIPCEQKKYLINNYVKENLTAAYQKLAARRVEFQAEIHAFDAPAQYWVCFQEFADTLDATILQLEECGYHIADNHPLSELHDYFKGECDRVRDEFKNIEDEGKHRARSEEMIMQRKGDAISNLLKDTSIKPSDSINMSDIPEICFQKINTTLKRQLNQLQTLDETVNYNDDYESFDLEITRPILINANNLVRAYELETQQSLDMGHPLKRLASFSHATDDQLSQWIASGDQKMHPVYAAINKFYYDRAKKALVTFTEDHLLEDEIETNETLLSRTGLAASGYAPDDEEDEFSLSPPTTHRLMRRRVPHAGSYQDTISSSDDEDEVRLDPPKPKRRRHHPQSRSVKSSEDLRQHRYTRKHLPSADLRDNPMIYSEEE